MTAPRRRHIPTAVRAAVWDKTGGVCVYCGVQTHPFRTFTIDHVVPVIQGGDDQLANLVPCCLRCNQAKQDRQADQFQAAAGNTAAPTPEVATSAPYIPLDAWLSVAQVARLCGRSRQQVIRWVRSGELEADDPTADPGLLRIARPSVLSLIQRRGLT